MDSQRRAPLAALDANAQPSPAKSSSKRAAEDTASPTKKICRERSRSTSPDASSVFDAADASWATTTTEPDLTPPLPRASMTREQAREKAQILRLRLGLANYKLRTGQTDVPLAELKPVHGGVKLKPTMTPRKRLAGVASLTNSARRGGAASGLLSLARGDSVTQENT